MAIVVIVLAYIAQAASWAVQSAVLHRASVGQKRMLTYQAQLSFVMHISTC